MGVPLSQQAQKQDPENEVAKWTAAIVHFNFITHVFPTVKRQHVFCEKGFMPSPWWGHSSTSAWVLSTTGLHLTKYGWLKQFLGESIDIAESEAEVGLKCIIYSCQMRMCHSCKSHLYSGEPPNRSVQDWESDWSWKQSESSTYSSLGKTQSSWILSHSLPASAS